MRYSWNFTTAAPGTVKSVAFDVPPGTVRSALSMGDAFGVTAGGSVTLSGTTVTYTLVSGLSVAAGVNVLLAVDGFTDTAARSTGSSLSPGRPAPPAAGWSRRAG